MSFSLRWMAGSSASGHGFEPELTSFAPARIFARWLRSRSCTACALKTPLTMSETSRSSCADSLLEASPQGAGARSGRREQASTCGMEAPGTHSMSGTLCSCKT